MIIGITKEVDIQWERRVALTPKQIKTLISQDLQFIVQPSRIRIFKDNEFQDVGCKIQEDLSECQIILSVRQIEESQILKNKTYMFFSHALKAQKNTRSLINTMVQNQNRLIDYEMIKNKNGERQVYFGETAGLSAAINLLAGLGIFLLKKGLSTPFLNIKQSYKYYYKQDAVNHICLLKDRIQDDGIPLSQQPLIIGITGKGKTAIGVQNLLQNLDIKLVDPDQLHTIYEQKTSQIYVTIIEAQHMVESKDNTPFNKSDYYENPNHYKPIFHQKYLKYISVLFNCHYWEQKFPRLITKQQIKELAQSGQSRLLAVCDLACDLHGSVEFDELNTDINKLYQTYDPINQVIKKSVDNIENGILLLSHDKFASLLPYTASQQFGSQLIEHLQQILKLDLEKPFDQQDCSQEVLNAVIMENGQLTNQYQNLLKMYEYIECSKTYDDDNDQQTVFSISINGNIIQEKLMLQLFQVLQKQNIHFQLDKIQISNVKNQSSKITFNFYDAIDTEKLKEFNEICDTNQVKYELH